MKFYDIIDKNMMKM